VAVSDDTAAALEEVQADAVSEFAVVVLDPPADLGQRTPAACPRRAKEGTDVLPLTHPDPYAMMIIMDHQRRIDPPRRLKRLEPGRRLSVDASWGSDLPPMCLGSSL
jgi:hypothetical protein